MASAEPYANHPHLAPYRTTSPHHSIFTGLYALPDAQPTVPKHWRQITSQVNKYHPSRVFSERYTSKRVRRHSISQLDSIIRPQVKWVSLDSGHKSIKEVGKLRTIRQHHVAILSVCKVQLTQICPALKSITHHCYLHSHSVYTYMYALNTSQNTHLVYTGPQSHRQHSTIVQQHRYLHHVSKLCFNVIFKRNFNIWHTTSARLSPRTTTATSV